jgi:cytochrome c biogenesis protein CcdA
VFDDELSFKVGQYLLFVGLIILILFFASDQAGEPIFSLFCVGILLIPFGIYMMFRFRKPPAPSDRFSAVRKWQQARKTAKQGKRDKRDGERKGEREKGS